MVNSKKIKTSNYGIAEKLYLWILLAIFGGIVLHAPISVGLSTLWPDYSLIIKSWKEILMLVASVIAIILLYNKRKMSILKQPLMIGIMAYALIHLVISLFPGENSFKSTIAGLMIDLRYVLYFALVYIAMQISPRHKNLFLKVGICGALVVMIFALLQVFVLPIDILKYIGYSDKTILPYLTLDLNYDFIRINSTLRGPNPLGAYSVMVLAGLLSWYTSRKNDSKSKLSKVVLILFLGASVSIWTSYSRSAILALIVTVLIILKVNVFKEISKKVLKISTAVIIVLGILIVSVYKTDVVSNVILHDNPNGGSDYTSNDGHAKSLKEGIVRLALQPFGAGVGSTGSASLFGNSSIVIENQYLFIAHEVGWLGLMVFCVILAAIFKSLWKQRSDWLALTVFSSGIGMLLINIFLPIWVDDTVSIIWWGLAGVVVGSKWYMVDSKEQKAQEGY